MGVMGGWGMRWEGCGGLIGGMRVGGYKVVSGWGGGLCWLCVLVGVLGVGFVGLCGVWGVVLFLLLVFGLVFCEGGVVIVWVLDGLRW